VIYTLEDFIPPSGGTMVVPGHFVRNLQNMGGTRATARAVCKGYCPGSLQGLLPGQFDRVRRFHPPEGGQWLCPRRGHFVQPP